MKFKNINRVGDAYHVYKNRRSFLNMIKAARKGDYKISAFTYLATLVTLVYTISPIDFIPDVLALVGWVDDGALWFLLIQQWKKELDKFAKTPITQDASFEVINEK